MTPEVVGTRWSPVFSRPGVRLRKKKCTPAPSDDCLLSLRIDAQLDHDRFSPVGWICVF